MIAWLMNQLRMGKCDHDWDAMEVLTFQEGDDPGKNLPIRRRWVMRCKKCGYTRTKYV